MSTLLRDLRYAFRRMRRSPGFAAVCVITLALGIGANTAIFTLVDAVMLKSLPVADPSQLYLGDPLRPRSLSDRGDVYHQHPALHRDGNCAAGLLWRHVAHRPSGFLAAEQLDLNFNQDKLIARLTELFGLLALILACVGLYGVTSYSVARRTNEISIRMALGANRANFLWLVLRGALIQLGIGLAIGIPVALAGGRLTASQLYGVKSYNPAILSLAVVVLALCAVLATLVPARRAASIDPMQALRTE